MIMSPDNRLSQLVGREVMLWHLDGDTWRDDEENDTGWRRVVGPDEGESRQLWSPATDLNQALLVLGKFRDFDPTANFGINSYPESPLRVSLFIWSVREWRRFESDVLTVTSLPSTICDVSLQAVRSGVVHVRRQ